MQNVIENLVRLGLKEYEAKVYVALAGIGEANARTIHEVSGVPRPRVYDVLGDLTSKGFVEIKEGSPLVYCPVPPELVISQLQKDLNQAADESIATLNALSLNVRQKYVPLWHVRGDWSIMRHLKTIVDRVTDTFLVFANDESTSEKYASIIEEAAKKCPVKILIKAEAKGRFVPIPGVSYYEIDQMNPPFKEYIFDKIYTDRITQDNGVFLLECLILSDDRESMWIYTLDGERMGIINALPVFVNVQSQAFALMIEGAHKIAGDDEQLHS